MSGAQSQSGRTSSSDLSRTESGTTGGGGSGGSSMGQRLRSGDDSSASPNRMSIAEEVAQQELNEIARKNDAEFEALLAKVRLSGF